MLSAIARLYPLTFALDVILIGVCTATGLMAIAANETNNGIFWFSLASLNCAIFGLRVANERRSKAN